MERWEVESERLGMIWVFSEKLMGLEMMLAQLDQMRRRKGGRSGEDLRMNMAAELLNPDWIKS